MKISIFCALSLLLTGLALAEQPFMQGKRFACGDYGGKKVCIVEADGSISWQHKAPSCNDLWLNTTRRVRPCGKSAMQIWMEIP